MRVTSASLPDEHADRAWLPARVGDRASLPGMQEAVGPILRRALAEADRRGVRGPRISHLAAADVQMLSQATLEHLRTRPAQPSPQPGWMQISSFAAGVARWWNLQLGEPFPNDVSVRLRTLRRDIYDHLQDDQLLIIKEPGQTSPVHLSPAGEVLDAQSRDLRPISITVGEGGAGFGDPGSNRLIETAAMEAATLFFVGWSHTDVSHENCGWDITFRRGNEEVHAEVKGVAGRKASVLLTSNEYAVAGRDEQWRLIVVTRALVAPQVQEVDRLAVIDLARPYVFRVAVPGHEHA